MSQEEMEHLIRAFLREHRVTTAHAFDDLLRLLMRVRDASSSSSSHVDAICAWLRSEEAVDIAFKTSAGETPLALADAVEEGAWKK